MEINTENTVAGTVISSHGSTPRQNRIRYQIALAVLDKLLHDGELSESDYHKYVRGFGTVSYNPDRGVYMNQHA